MREPKPIKSLQRKKPYRYPYDRVMIVCEGGKTERYYFEDLRSKFKLKTANVEVYGQGSDPGSLVKFALKKFREARKEIRENGSNSQKIGELVFPRVSWDSKDGPHRIMEILYLFKVSRHLHPFFRPISDRHHLGDSGTKCDSGIIGDRRNC